MGQSLSCFESQAGPSGLHSLSGLHLYVDAGTGGDHLDAPLRPRSWLDDGPEAVEPVVGMGAALAQARSRPREHLPFRAVNTRTSPDYDPGLQRHHLLPRQLLQKRCFGPLFDLLGRERVGFEDFRTNGLLLPASDATALRFGLPMHRGPHHDYNALVIERVGQVEAGWSTMRLRAPEVAATEAVSRLKLLQRALRRRLLDPRRKKFTLNRHDPLGREQDFSDLDRMAESLWGDTQAIPVAPCPEALIMIIRPAGGMAPGAGSAFSF